ncbi:hypothetical protein BU24DRAFT_283395 [Aaosphaeria arxii CBS 175.79]|uniref:Uncharacterized protein n=1 Tax=Aaosphaeria arxii CBS 175.79 TaxID=1450172 RepID=A0A6A5XFD6_9PLEO|nr:uncharacterized protein BU24DRAFT_283395 [Aaosphaeria arxii CBS 175.79]KAF2011541.1 hypothetical protein BU24DRAFT_283395 [Aaosphaeria arxii CBS 175.79]
MTQTGQAPGAHRSVSLLSLSTEYNTISRHQDLSLQSAMMLLPISLRTYGVLIYLLPTLLRIYGNTIYTSHYLVHRGRIFHLFSSSSTNIITAIIILVKACAIINYLPIH